MRIILDDHIRLYEVLHGIHQYTGEDIELIIPSGSIFKNFPANVNLIKKAGQHLGKRVRLVNEDGSMVSSTDEHSTSPVLVAAQANKPALPDVTDDDEEIEEKAPTVKSAKRSRGPLTPVRLIAVFSIVLILALGGAGFFVLYYLPRGVVTLYVNEKVLERSGVVSVDSTIQAVDEEASKVPGRKIEVAIEESQTFNATGKKTIGEKAKGTVVVQNYSDSSIELAAGTVVKTGETTFVLDARTRVPEATISDDDRIIPGESAPASVTASDIGDTYNVKAESEFAVGDYKTRGLGSVRALNDQAFAGGSTKDVTIISADDHKKALDQLRSKITSDAPTRLKSEAKGGENFAEATIQYDVKFADYDRAVGVESDKFALTLKMSATVIAYNEADIKSILSKVARDNVPDGFKVANEEESLAIEKVEGQNASGISVKAKLATLVVPDIDTQSVRDELINKRPQQAEDILRGIEHVDGYDIRIWPILPDFVRSMPHMSDRLEVKVEVKDGTSTDAE